MFISSLNTLPLMIPSGDFMDIMDCMKKHHDYGTEIAMNMM